MALTSIELFAGAGGLAMGTSLAGFRSQGVVEWDRWACDTVRQNQRKGYPLVADWPLFEGDVRQWAKDFPGDGLVGQLDLLAGGPPCQPFSMGGKHQANLDARDMFPATVEVIRRLRPRAFIVENVKGLTRASFANYFEYIQTQLQFPEVQKRPDESWVDHHHRLQVVKTSKTRGGGLRYRLVTTLVNAANYGIPQKRERVFMVGFRSDIDARWSFPCETHSLDALLHEQWVSGDYWHRHRVPLAHRRFAAPAHQKVAERLKGLRLLPTLAPWRTVRDALQDMPEPGRADSSWLNHRFQDGARSYPGHTGSPLDLPAKTLKAGGHGVPGGENMMVRDDGSVRYFSVRESARLQTFPDAYELHGAWSEAMRQLGNAVPMALGQIVASSVASHLLLADHRARLQRQQSLLGALA
jgi:DNA (cytosine-5)-methyltransferase 1